MSWSVLCNPLTYELDENVPAFVILSPLLYSLLYKPVLVLGLIEFVYIPKNVIPLTSP